MLHLNAWIFSYQQCKTSGISANMHAHGIRQITVNIKKGCGPNVAHCGSPAADLARSG